MKRIHLLLVEGQADEYLDLIEALRADGKRVGWLDLGGAQVPTALSLAAETGVLRAVAVDEGVTVTVKPRAGSAVMKDLLREYFVGCSVVLIRGGKDLPRLSAVEGRWLLEGPGATTRRLETEGLVAALGRPRLFEP